MLHGRRDGRVALGDREMHGLGDRAVARVALAGGAELRQVHRLAGVEVQHVADAVAEAERVGRRLGAAGGREPVVLGVRALERARGRASPQAGVGDLLRHLGAEVRASAAATGR